jgi:hypothetical protein
MNLGTTHKEKILILMGKGNLGEDKKLFDCSGTRSDWEKEIWVKIKNCS